LSEIVKIRNNLTNMRSVNKVEQKLDRFFNDLQPVRQRGVESSGASRDSGDKMWPSRNRRGQRNAWSRQWERGYRLAGSSDR